jgi:glycosyltransferase involved in cell wall biosynthesis
MKEKISVVIAALNEAPRIARVLEVVTKSPLIDEVLVVNDGSTDNTSEVVKKFNVKLIENKQNIGKTLSVKKGVESSKNELIMLLDADLVGLSLRSIEDLARPVLSGETDWSISLRDNSLRMMRLLGIDWISGERVIPKTLLKDPLIWSRPEIGFGLETLMNKSLLKRGKTFHAVRLQGVINTRKSEKVGLLKGTFGDYWVVSQISKVMPLHKFYMQFLQMAFLNKKYSKL